MSRGSHLVVIDGVEYVPRSMESAPGDWRPIETAPKGDDAPEILVCRAWNADGEPMGDGFGLFVQRASWWSKEGDDGRGAWIIYNSMVRDPEVFFEPTHWMPVPAGPSQVESPTEGESR